MLAGKEPVQGERLLMLVEKKKQNWDELTNDSFYPIGMTGTISDTGNNEFIVISSGERASPVADEGETDLFPGTFPVGSDASELYVTVEFDRRDRLHVFYVAA